MDYPNFWEDLRSGKLADMIRETTKNHTVGNTRELFNIMKPLIAAHMDVEKFYTVFLDSKNRVICIEEMFTGSINSASIYPREIVKRVLALQAAAIILVHNHPSGDTEPSREDFNVTARIMLAMTCIGVTVHDHVIIGSNTYSMVEDGRLPEFKMKIEDYISGGHGGD